MASGVTEYTVNQGCSWVAYACSTCNTCVCSKLGAPEPSFTAARYKVNFVGTGPDMVG